MTNLVEILRNAPKGLELYSPLYGKVKLHCVKPNSSYPIAVERDSKVLNYWFDKYGCISEDSECLLFPSKENREWDNWQKTLIKVGHFVALDSICGTTVIKVKNIVAWGKYVRFATTEEIEQWYRIKEESAFKINDLKPFDKVLGFTEDGWEIDLFSNYCTNENETFPYHCLRDYYRKCIPYNDETKHLLGTAEEYNGKYKTW